MKNLLTYISPDKGFNEEHSRLVKIQIDNSISLGWDVKDIVLVTNFDYKYGGVEAIVIGDDNYCIYHWPATKIYVIDRLFKMSLIEDDLYWYHDFDCFQLAPFTESIIESADMGLTNYGRMPRLCSASMFFKKSSEDIFHRLKKFIDKYEIEEELGIMRLINNNIETLGKRVELINITYAFHKFNLRHCYYRAIKPIKAAHFHITPDKLEFFVKGNNPLNTVLIPKKLINIFGQHGFK